MLKYLNPSYYLRTAQRGGYTIDQTILIVVIIAILITLVILTIGWALINRTSGTKLGSQMEQVADGIGQFYGDTRMWPHQAFLTGATPQRLAAIVAGQRPGTGGATYVANLPADLSNYLSGYRLNAAGTVVFNGFAGAGDIQIMNGRANGPMNSGNQEFIIIQFNQVPFAEGEEAEEAVDGRNNIDFTRGRFVFSTATCLPAAPVAGVPQQMPAITAPTNGTGFACYVGPSVI